MLKIFKRFTMQPTDITTNHSGMKIIVGLGNPGEKYTKTRHNIGWQIVDKLAVKYNAPTFKKNKKLKAEVTEVRLNNKKYILVKPLTFMNLSGESLSLIKQFFKKNNEDFIIIYDDIDIPFEQIKIKESGGAGTHNGMKSVVKYLGKSFIRLKFGIEGRTVEEKKLIPLDKYVLGKFSKKEELKLDNLIDHAIKELEHRLKN